VVRELQPGDPRTIGPYRLAGRLGQGGMGQVFLGVSAGGRPVAVKAIRPELTSDPQFRSRFAQEVAAARRVSGLFTATVVDADVDGPIPWLATVYVPGLSLAEAVASHGPLPEASLLSLAAGLAESLNAIHASGVVHRDLKPSNVLLAEDGPRVIDFGISRATESSALTQTNLVVGSPGFMSPEQAIGTAIGSASDIFSLGAVLAFAATGQGPFGTGTTASLLYRVVHEAPNLDRVPARLRPLIERCLTKDPAQRPVAAGVVAEVGALHSGGDWLPDSIIRMLTPNPGPAAAPVPAAANLVSAAAPVSDLAPVAAPAADPVPAAPPAAAAPAADLAPAAVPAFGLVPAPRLAPARVAADEVIFTPPIRTTGQADGHPNGHANGQAGGFTGGPPPPVETGPPPRRHWARTLVLGSVAGGLAAATGAAVFGLLASTGHAPGPVQSRPAAQTTPAAPASSTVPGATTPAARPRATSPASVSPVGAVTQPAAVFPSASSAPASTPQTAPPSRSPSGTPTVSGSTTPPPTTPPATTPPPTTPPATTPPPTTPPATTPPPTTT
jgi:Protein kinase domain